MASRASHTIFLFFSQSTPASYVVFFLLVVVEHGVLGL
jgi:hypothetical protein